MDGISKNKIKYLKSLRQSKFRQKYNKFVVENDKTAIEFLRSNKYTINEVYVLSKWAEKNDKVLNNWGNQVRVITDKEMSQITLLQSPSPVYILVEKLEEQPVNKVTWKNFSIYLDRVQDPGNVGTIIRIADWFGFSSVIRSVDSADFYNPKTIQSTMGSMVNVDLHTATYDEIPVGLPVFGALLNGQNLSDIAWPEKGLLVVGNESKGISPALQARVDTRVYIPGSENRVAESLNAAIATSIIAQNIFSRRS